MMTSPISRRSFLQAAGAAGAAGLLSACGGPSAADSAPAGPSDGAVSLTISWWGDDTRRAAYQEALTSFFRQHPNITVTPSTGEWEDWEDTMSAKFAAGTAEDLCQIPWNWLQKYSADAQTFLDLSSVSDYLDLSQWEEIALSPCRVADAQQAVPMAFTGRIFFWNSTAFQSAGITGVPRTLEDLYAAGEAFRDQLGENCYPLYLDGYGRMCLAVFYLESVYGRPWADPASSTLNYSLTEIAEGLDFIKDLVDRHVLMPLPTYYGINGASPVHLSSQWSTGQLGGVFDWDYTASLYQQALDEDNRAGFAVGEEIPLGPYKGGFTMVAAALAISQSCQHPAEAAMLMDFLLNQETGAAILGSVCGIPASRAGLAAAQAAGTLDPLTEEAHSKVAESCLFQADPLFEDSTLAADNGIYQQVFETIDYDGVSGSAVVKTLTDAMGAAGYSTNL